jgi:hypothetical protein
MTGKSLIPRRECASLSDLKPSRYTSANAIDSPRLGLNREGTLLCDSSRYPPF